MDKSLFDAKISGLSEEKQSRVVKNPVLFSDLNPEVYVLVDYVLEDADIIKLRKAFRAYSGNSDLRLSFIYPFKYDVWDKTTQSSDLDKGKSLQEFVYQYTIDLTKIIPPESKVISVGRAIFATTFDTGILSHHFHDHVWNNSYFYSGIIRCWIFPVDGFSAWYGLSFIQSESSNMLRKTLVRQFVEHQVETAYTYQPVFERTTKPEKITIKDWRKFFIEHEDETIVSWDLETTSLDWDTGDIICITFSFNGLIGYYLDWDDEMAPVLSEFLENKKSIGANLKFDIRFLYKKGVKIPQVYFDTLQAGHILNEIRSNRLKSHAFIYTKHGGYDLELEKYKRRYHIKNYSQIRPDILRDYAAMDSIEVYQVYEAMLDHLAEDSELMGYFWEFIMPVYNMMIETEIYGACINWDKVAETYTELYAEQEKAKDKVYEALGIDEPEVIVKKKKRKGNERRGTTKPLFDLTGILPPEKKDKSEAAKRVIDSGPKLGRLLESLGWKDLGRSKKSVGEFYLTKEDNLTEWTSMIGTGDVDYSAAPLITEYRKLHTMVSTFIGNEKDNTGIWQHKRSTGRVHPDIGVCMARTHRHRYTAPNLNNQPHHGPLARAARQIFDVPGDDWAILSLDQAGLQLRIGAMLSNDERMRKAFTSGSGDIHSVTAQAIFRPDLSVEEFRALVKTDTETSDQRHAGKQVNFKFLFGGQARSFSEDTIKKEWSSTQCEEYIEKNNLIATIVETSDGWVDDYFLTVATDLRTKFFEAYPGLEKWVTQTPEIVASDGYARALSGARRLLPELIFNGGADMRTTSPVDRSAVSNMRNISLNSPVQSLEALIVTRAMLHCRDYLRDNGYKSRPFLIVHDEIVFYLHQSEMETIPVIKAIMEKPYDIYNGIPLKVDAEISRPRDKENPTYWGYGEEL